MGRYCIQRIEYEFGLLYVYVADTETTERTLFEIFVDEDNGKVKVTEMIKEGDR